MKQQEFTKAVEEIVQADPRFSPEAYEFISDAVAYTARKLGKAGRTRNRHITGQELLSGIREYALQQFGPLTLDVLRDWGIHDSLCIGHIVFNMVDSQLLGKSDQDSLKDFARGFDFVEAFSRPFAPEQERVPVPPVIA
jgi:uncharacterized repeat protein (TIGR04138 family)